MTKQTAAQLATRALEELGVRHTFGIPGVHNTELYDQLAMSDSITPILVTSEFCGGFMAEAMSRVSDSIGTLVLVPAAGVTHAMSGIGEAFLDGIPMLVITGGVRQETPFRYQLHQLDQRALVAGITKAAFTVTSYEEVTETIFEAYRIATSGVPGPVLVEIPVDLQMNVGEVGPQPLFAPAPVLEPNEAEIDAAVAALSAARKPVLYLGWGARGAGEEALVALAERLGAPVATTLQGLGVFPHEHPLHAGFGFGPAAVPAARAAFAEHDLMLAIGTRFSEIATGSFSIEPPQGLIHVDIDPEVPGANYPVAQAITADAARTISALLDRLPQRSTDPALPSLIAQKKAKYHSGFARGGDKKRVNPAHFFSALRAASPDDLILTMDDGNHTFLVAELWEHRRGGMVISPTDFNAMGYAIPAAVAAKLAHPEREVACIVGDGCARMTGLELATASAHRLPLVAYVFSDGELSQIAQAQQLPYNRKTCTVLPSLDLAGLASATGASYLPLKRSSDASTVISQARELAERTSAPVLVDIRIDYSQSTAFTKGIIKTNFSRFPGRDKVRIVRRAITRKVTG